MINLLEIIIYLKRWKNETHENVAGVGRNYSSGYMPLMTINYICLTPTLVVNDFHLNIFRNQPVDEISKKEFFIESVC